MCEKEIRVVFTPQKVRRRHLLKKNLVHIVLQTWPAESLERGGVDVDA